MNINDNLNDNYSHLDAFVNTSTPKSGKNLSLKLNPEQFDLDIKQDEVGTARKPHPEFCGELERETLYFRYLPVLQGLVFLKNWKAGIANANNYRKETPTSFEG